MEVNEKFKPLFTSDKRYFLLTGGRGSGKSYAAKTWEALLTHELGHTILDTRYTLKSAQKSTIPELIEKISELGHEDYFHVTNDVVTNLRTRSNIIFSGIKTSAGNQTANLKSLQGVTTWVLDEAEELLDEDTFDKIDLSIRKKGIKNRVVLIMNPTTREHWVWQRWFEGHTKYVEIEGYQIPVSTHPQIEHIHTTYLDNRRNLNGSFLDNINLIKENSPEKYRHKILGGWLDKAEGVIFENWKEGEFDESLPYIYGMDFGFYDPDTLVKVAIKDNNLYVKECLYQKGLSTSELVSVLHGLEINKNDLIVADNADPKTISDLIASGFNVAKAQKGPDSVRNGIKRLQDYNIIVHPNSHNLKKELNNYCWNDKKSETPIDDYNHLIDPIRYAEFEISPRNGFFII